MRRTMLALMMGAGLVAATVFMSGDARGAGGGYFDTTQVVNVHVTVAGNYDVGSFDFTDWAWQFDHYQHGNTTGDTIFSHTWIIRYSAGWIMNVMYVNGAIDDVMYVYDNNYT